MHNCAAVQASIDPWAHCGCLCVRRVCFHGPTVNACVCTMFAFTGPNALRTGASRGRSRVQCCAGARTAWGRTACGSCLAGALRVGPAVWAHCVWVLPCGRTACGSCLAGALRVGPAVWAHCVGAPCRAGGRTCP